MGTAHCVAREEAEAHEKGRTELPPMDRSDPLPKAASVAALKCSFHSPWSVKKASLLPFREGRRSFSCGLTVGGSSGEGQCTPSLPGLTSAGLLSRSTGQAGGQVSRSVKGLTGCSGLSPGLTTTPSRSFMSEC